MSQPTWHQLSECHINLSDAIFMLGRASEMDTTERAANCLTLIEEQLDKVKTAISKQKRDWITNMSQALKEGGK